MASKIQMSLDRTPEGRFQLSIDAVDENGSGSGFRIFGPKYDGRSTTIQKRTLTADDAAEIRRYLDKVRPTDAA